MATTAIATNNSRASTKTTTSYWCKFDNFFSIRKDLDLGQVAEGFGLLKMPKMPELKGRTVESFSPTDIEVDNIPYQDKGREKQRKKRLQEQQEGSIATLTGKKRRFRKESVPWSKSKERDVKREKRKARREYLRQQRKQKHTFNDDELEELAQDARLVKKMKRRKISKEDFQAHFMENAED